jgi:lauroyl/myristoyl acyltransferase
MIRVGAEPGGRTPAHAGVSRRGRAWRVGLLRGVRHWVTARATDAALLAAPRLSVAAADRIGALLGRCGQHLPLVARQVADNMRALGVYTAGAQREYFRQLGTHFAGALLALRTSRDRPAADLASLAVERVRLDPSVLGLRSALATGRGVILMGPHIVNYLLNLARLSQELPLTVYLRFSHSARRRAAKERWYQASGVGWISEAAEAGGPLGRLGRMAEALRRGRVLFITPDLPQPCDRGTPVRFFGREIYLPAGPALLALRSGAPLFLLLATVDGRQQRLLVQGPYDDAGQLDHLGGRKAAVQRRLQWFASGLERFLRTQTPLWYLWGDKRWTRLLRGDPRYVSPLPPGME